MSDAQRYPLHFHLINTVKFVSNSENFLNQLKKVDKL